MIFILYDDFRGGRRKGFNEKGGLGKGMLWWKGFLSEKWLNVNFWSVRVLIVLYRVWDFCVGNMEVSVYENKFF